MDRRADGHFWNWVLPLLLGISEPVVASAGPIISGETFNPVVWGPTAISSGYLQYGFHEDTGSTASEQFLNVVGADGSWLVQNIPVGDRVGSEDVVTNVGASLFHPGIAYQTFLSDAIQPTAPAATAGSIRSLGAPVNYVSNEDSGVTDFGDFHGPGPYAPPKPPKPILEPPPPPDEVQHYGVPSLVQGTGQCAPTAVAMSLSWIIQHYQFPQVSDVTIIRNDLASPAFMNTTPDKGTSLGAISNGEGDYVNAIKLPVVQFGIDNSGPGFAVNLMTALGRGDDVELVWDWIGGSGHVVTVIGARNLTKTAFDKDPEQVVEIWFIDPSDGKTHEDTLTVTSPGNNPTIYVSGYGAYVSEVLDDHPTPEPGTMSLFAIGAAGLALTGFVKKRNPFSVRPRAVT